MIAARYMRGAPRLVGTMDVANDSLTEIAELAATAGLPYRYHGGKPPAIAFHRAPDARALLPSGRPLYVLDERNLPRNAKGRAIRSLEVLAYAFLDPIAREITRGVFR